MWVTPNALPFDLHVLSMPPAFNLSQDQTLQFKLLAAQRQRIQHDEEHPKSFGIAHIDCLLAKLTIDASAHTNYLNLIC